MIKINKFAIGASTGLLASAAVVAGLSKVWTQFRVPEVGSFGYPPELQRWIGLAAIAAGIAMMVPGLSWRGALFLSALVAAGAVQAGLAAEWGQTLVTALLGVSFALSAWLRHPGFQLRRRIQAAADWVAAREIEEHRLRILSGTNLYGSRQSRIGA